MKEALSQLQSSLEKVQRQEKGLKRFLLIIQLKKEDWLFQSSFLFICVLTHYLFAVRFVL